MTARRTPLAERDIDDILTETIRLFGERQFARYVDLIERAIAAVARDPMLLSSRARPEIGAGVRSFRLDDVGGKPRPRASHQLFYVALPGEVVILRVLHERMASRRHVAEVLRSDLKRS